jgi:DNA polymerase-3 subunit beta
MNNFVKALKKAVSIIPRNVSYPALGTVLLQGDGKNLNIVATNDEISIKITVDCSFKIDCCVNGKLLCDFLQSAKDVQLEQEEQSLKIYSDNSELELPIFPSQEFPSLPESTGDKISIIFASDLKDSLKKVGFIPIREWHDESFKTSILFDYQYGLLKVVASDDHRLAVCLIITNEEEITEHKKALLSRDVILGLENILPGQGKIDVQFGDNLLTFSYADVEESMVIFTRLVSGEFPNYERVVPKEELGCCDCEFWRENLIQSLKRASLVTDVINIVVNDNFEISGFSERGKFKEIVPTIESCGTIEIMCDLKHLLQPLSRIEDEKVKLKFVGEKSPMVLESKNYIYVVMPVEANL